MSVQVSVAPPLLRERERQREGDRERERERETEGGEEERERESVRKCPCFKIRKTSAKQTGAENAICGGLLRQTRVALFGEIECARKRTGVGPPRRRE